MPLAFLELTQGSAKPPPWAEFCYAYNVNDTRHTIRPWSGGNGAGDQYDPGWCKRGYSGNVLSETNTPVTFSGWPSVTFPPVPDLVLPLTISRIRSKMIASKINPPRNELAK
jgi:hypothetical protein